MTRTIAIHKQVLDKIKLQIERTVSMAEEIQTPLQTTISKLSKLLESFDKYSNGKPMGEHIEIEQLMLSRWVEDLKDLAFRGESLLNIMDEIFEDVRDREDDLNLYLE
ncbi:MAG: hypothetical protein ACW976_03690 [Candidatus Ranarchaeia archaeon]